MNTQPKIDISAEQLRSIYVQFQTILDEKVNLHLPQEKDTVRQEVLLQLQQFLVETMEMTSNSLNVVDVNSGTSISDLIAQSQQQFVEPFDLDLNENVRQKYQEWEDHTVKVAQLRREAPKRLRAMYEQEVTTALANSAELIDSLTQNVDEDIELEVKLENRDELVNDYHESLQNLAEAQKQLPKNRGNVQKLEQLVSYLEGELGSSLTDETQT